MTKTKMLLVVLALACAGVYAAETKNVDKMLPLNRDGRVTLETHNGLIQVRTWDRADIEVHARIEAASSSSADLSRFNDTTVEIGGSASSVRIKSRYPESGLWFWFGSNPQIHYTVIAPRGARWTIRNHNARTEMSDIGSSLDIETHNGDVRVMNLSGPLNLEMHNGNATVEFGAFEAASSIDMHNGSVELALPRNSRFDLRSSTHRGQVDSDFPGVSQAAWRRNYDVDARVNGGGPALRLNAHDGRFRISREVAPKGGQ